MSGAFVASLHDAAGTGVLVVAGGGAGAVARLLAVPGASRTVLEATVPYAATAMNAFLGGPPDRACDPTTARALAMAAFRRARLHDPDGARFGLGCTASLATDRPKQGAHRVHVALQTEDATHLWSLTLERGARSRAEEEALCDALVLGAVAEAKGLPVPTIQGLRQGEKVDEVRHGAEPHWRELLLERTRVTAHIGAAAPEPGSPRLVFPGAFDPVHEGHLEMARIAEARTGMPVEFELCVANVDKPPLNYADIAQRTAGFPEGATVWLTAAARFQEKAELFPRATFVVGLDTIVRIAEPRYYGGDLAARDRAVAELTERGCRFLVFGRRLEERFLTLEDVELPAALRAICAGVPEAVFRADISSTSLRLLERDG